MMIRFSGFNRSIRPLLFAGALAAVLIGLNGCVGTTPQVIPTSRPTESPTPLVTATETPTRAPTRTPTPQPVAQGGPTPTSLFGPTRTPNPDDPTPTRTPDPDAPRIDFFTTNTVSVPPGGTISLFWATRNVNRAVIYRLDRAGEPLEVINVGEEGRYEYDTSRQDRGQVDFRLVAGEDDEEVQAELSVALACPIPWFFGPPPIDCPNDPAEETMIIEQPFERGRMLYVASSDRIYALYNDGSQPAWASYANLYDPEIHPESIDDFPAQPGRYQPIARLGYLWRGNDTVRNRLGLGTADPVEFQGFLQSANPQGGGTAFYITSTNRVVLHLLPRGQAWLIITAP